MKVWVVIEVDARNNTGIVGVCSSERTARRLQDACYIEDAQFSTSLIGFGYDFLVEEYEVRT